ncbi:MAG: hypothetical protein EHM55_05775 [Acidobacteria bacterium]|nr:MAG: hypothetical protein EHM55_05775 [Acidobacteriota bacterium]
MRRTLEQGFAQLLDVRPFGARSPQLSLGPGDLHLALLDPRCKGLWRDLGGGEVQQVGNLGVQALAVSEQQCGGVLLAAVHQ